MKILSLMKVGCGSSALGSSSDHGVIFFWARGDSALCLGGSILRSQAETTSVSKMLGDEASWSWRACLLRLWLT